MLTKNILKWSSSFFAVLGGMLVSSRTEVSPFGFIFLALSSSQLLLFSLIGKDKAMVVYSGAVFFFVDCLGVYRWLIY
jgi:hypothetical protein